MPEPSRTRALTGPDVRGFLSEVATWSAIRHLALVARGVPSRTTGVDARLFDLVSRTQHLATLVPSGRIDPGFRSRCVAFSRRQLENAVFDLAAFVLGLRLAHPSAASLRLTLRFGADAEQGRPDDRIDLGTFAGPAGPLAIEAARGPVPGSLRAELRHRTLVLEAAGFARTVIPAAGTRLLIPDMTSRRRLRSRKAGDAPFRLVRRVTLPGTSIVLTPVVESRPGRLRVTRDASDLDARLARALRIVLVAWPEACREIERRTFAVVPIHEPGTVSYSMAARPGISFINVFGKPLLALADDLLHETAHHRLHDIQETAVLLRGGADTREVQAFDSPWRGARRPLHGLLHGVYTFLYRAELFRRIEAVARAHPRLLKTELGSAGLPFIRREIGRERRMIAAALRDLESAARAGLFTPVGRLLLRKMRLWYGGSRPV